MEKNMNGNNNSVPILGTGKILDITYEKKDDDDYGVYKYTYSYGDEIRNFVLDAGTTYFRPASQYEQKLIEYHLGEKIDDKYLAGFDSSIILCFVNDLIPLVNGHEQLIRYVNAIKARIDGKIPDDEFSIAYNWNGLSEELKNYTPKERKNMKKTMQFMAEKGIAICYEPEKQSFWEKFKQKIIYFKEKIVSRKLLPLNKENEEEARITSPNNNFSSFKSKYEVPSEVPQKAKDSKKTTDRPWSNRGENEGEER